MRCVSTQSNQLQFDLFIYFTLESINLLLDGDFPSKEQSTSNTLKPDPQGTNVTADTFAYYRRSVWSHDNDVSGLVCFTQIYAQPDYTLSVKKNSHFKWQKGCIDPLHLCSKYCFLWLPDLTVQSMCDMPHGIPFIQFSGA